MSKLTYIFVHGLAGWGSYDEAYQKKPYWGMKGGDIMAFLRENGFDCYAASVDPKGSAWDRACELYAQLAGTRVDYGEAHSREYKHERFGRDFSGCPLIPSLDETTRLALIGHSFGGTTVRLFAELMAHGDAAERKAAGESEISPLFRGGMEGCIFSIAALASPMNGTTAYDMLEDPSFDPESVRVPLWSKVMAKIMTARLKTETDGRDPRDFAAYDMHIDNSLKMNERMKELAGTYYFSVPASCTHGKNDGTFVPNKSMEPFFARRAAQMGAYAGTTKGGFAVDESWRENDGLVNTVSARAPLGAPAADCDRKKIEPGIWNVLPTYKADHMAILGGLTRRHDVKKLYLGLVRMIEGLA